MHINRTTLNRTTVSLMAAKYIIVWMYLLHIFTDTECHICLIQQALYSTLFYFAILIITEVELFSCLLVLFSETFNMHNNVCASYFLLSRSSKFLLPYSGFILCLVKCPKTTECIFKHWKQSLPERNEPKLGEVE